MLNRTVRAIRRVEYSEADTLLFLEGLKETLWESMHHLSHCIRNHETVCPGFSKAGLQEEYDADNKLYAAVADYLEFSRSRS